MGRQEIHGEQIVNESVETQDIKNSTILLEDLSQEVLDAMGGGGGVVSYNIDGGKSCTNYGGTTPIHGGTAGC